MSKALLLQDYLTYSFKITVRTEVQTYVFKYLKLFIFRHVIVIKKGKNVVETCFYLQSNLSIIFFK